MPHHGAKNNTSQLKSKCKMPEGGDGRKNDQTSQDSLSPMPPPHPKPLNDGCSDI